MSMYDEFSVKTTHPQLICVQGHSLKTFQTKDFDCLLDHYYLNSDNSLSRTRSNFFDNEEDQSKKAVLEDVSFTIMANIYTDCKQCQAAYTLCTTNDGRSWITEYYPNCEFEVFFKKGILQFIEPINLETPETVQKYIEQIAKSSTFEYKILSNTDPVLLKYLKDKDFKDRDFVRFIARVAKEPHPIKNLDETNKP